MCGLLLTKHHYAMHNCVYTKSFLWMSRPTWWWQVQRFKTTWKLRQELSYSVEAEECFLWEILTFILRPSSWSYGALYTWLKIVLTQTQQIIDVNHIYEWLHTAAYISDLLNNSWEQETATPACETGDSVILLPTTWRGHICRGCSSVPSPAIVHVCRCRPGHGQSPGTVFLGSAVWWMEVKPK